MTSRLAAAAVVCCLMSAGSAVAATGGTSVGAVLPSTGAVGGSAYDPATALSRVVHGKAVTPSSTSPAIPKHLGDRLPLRKGMSGHDVKVLQDFLGRIGLKVDVDGQYGSGTYKTIRSFEKRTGMPVNGVFQRADYVKLMEVMNNGGFDDLLPVPATTAQVALTPGEQATINPDGTANAPASAPDQVKAIIAAANEIATLPYRYGGGHQSFDDTGYDCSGSVSYALHGADLLSVPRDSTGLETFGLPGRGQWVTVYGKAAHAYMVVAGLRFDTSGRSEHGTRWQAEQRSSAGYIVRHPANL